MVMVSNALTVQDVSEYLNVDPKTVYRMVKRGELPGFKVGGSWRLHKADLDTWISRQKEVALKLAGNREKGGS
jgi:excisionase family DNA binding protein